MIFAAGDSPVPLALMGLTEGVNTFLDEDGMPLEDDVYIPAYIRRYPFLLARLRPDSDELSLCFDPTLGAVGEHEDGERLFDDDGSPTETTKAILQFCEQFETAGQRTGAFLEELKKSGLLMDGEVAIQPEGADKPFIYRGFQMVDEEKLRELRGDELRKMNQNGMLPLLVRASLLAVADPRPVQSPGRTGQGPDRHAGAGHRRRLKASSPLGGGRAAGGRAGRRQARARCVSISSATRSKPWPGSPSAAQIERAVDLDLQRMDAEVRRSVPLDHMAARERIVGGSAEAGFGGDPAGAGDDPRRRASPVEVAEYHLRRRWRRAASNGNRAARRSRSARLARSSLAAIES